MKPFPGVRQLYHLASAESTQTLARALAASGSPSGTMVWADAQTGGRGRMDRKWSSAPGGIYATLLLRPKVPPAALAELSVLAAGSVAAALSALGVKTLVKPPNDVLARAPRGKAWRKICGILAEASTRGGKTEWVLVGVGINVSNPLPRGLQAASLKSLLGRAPEPEAVLRRVLARFDRDLRAWLRRDVRSQPIAVSPAGDGARGRGDVRA